MSQSVWRQSRRWLNQEHGAKATFFLCSDYVNGFEDDAKELLADGHEFANHCCDLGVFGHMNSWIMVGCAFHELQCGSRES